MLKRYLSDGIRAIVEDLAFNGCEHLIFLFSIHPPRIDQKVLGQGLTLIPVCVYRMLLPRTSALLAAHFLLGGKQLFLTTIMDEEETAYQGVM